MATDGNDYLVHEVLRLRAQVKELEGAMRRIYAELTYGSAWQTGDSGTDIREVARAALRDGEGNR